MRFRYLADPLFVGSVILYLANRFLVKRLVSGGFLHTGLNDLICIPFWVPIMLFLLRKAGLRKHDEPPRADEILIPLILWSAWFELLLPRVRYFSRLAVADYSDVSYYTIGALAAWMLWETTYRDRCRDGSQARGRNDRQANVTPSVARGLRTVERNPDSSRSLPQARPRFLAALGMTMRRSCYRP